MTLLEMTFSGGLMILLITVIRVLAMDHLPKRTFLVLWGAALPRLLVPFSIPLQFSLFSIMERGTYAVSAPAAVTHNKELAGAARQSAVSVQAASGGISPWLVFWLLGFGLALLFFAAAYVRHLRRFRPAQTVDNAFINGWLASHPLRRAISVRESGSITAPLTYGVLRPVILIPAGLDWEDAETLNYVFTHEYVHIRRFDALLRLALTAALCVHWFNPLVWVMVILALRDVELSCDEAVIRELGLENRQAYALALLTMEETRQRFNAFVSGFSKNAAEKRIRAILKCRRTSTRRAAASALVIAFVLFAFCVTSAGAADCDTLVESPGLIRMSAEELGFTSEGGLCWLREGTFIKLTITGQGEGVFGFFLRCDKTDEVKGQWFIFDGGTHELWLEIPTDGHYRVCTRRDYQCVDGPDYFTYKVSYIGYASDGERLGARYHRQNMFRGYWTRTYTHTVD